MRKTTVCVQWLNKTNDWGHGRKEKTEKKARDAKNTAERRKNRKETQSLGIKCEEAMRIKLKRYLAESQLPNPIPLKQRSKE